MKKIIALLLIMLLLFYGCADFSPLSKTDIAEEYYELPESTAQSTPRPTAVPTEEPVLELMDQQIQTLNKLCYFVSDFSSPEDLDDGFMRNLLFMAYTCGWERKGSSEYDGVFYVDEASAEDYIRLVLGVEYDVRRLGYSEENRYCYFSDESLVVSASDYGDIWFSYRETREEEGCYNVDFDVMGGGEEESLGVKTMKILPADNENGFIVIGSVQSNYDQ